MCCRCCSPIHCVQGADPCLVHLAKKFKVWLRSGHPVALVHLGERLGTSKIDRTPHATWSPAWPPPSPCPTNAATSPGFGHLPGPRSQALNHPIRPHFTTALTLNIFGSPHDQTSSCRQNKLGRFGKSGYHSADMACCCFNTNNVPLERTLSSFLCSGLFAPSPSTAGYRYYIKSH